MAGRVFYGVNKNHDLDPSLIKPDVRPISHKIREFSMTHGNVILLIFAFISASALLYNTFIGRGPLPFYSIDIMFVLSFLYYLYASKNHAKFIYREGLDVESGENWDTDKGLIYLGNDNDGSALHFAADDVKTHMLVMGSTGSGKSRFLLGILYQSMLIGSGCCYVDGKGDNTVWWLVYSFCRRVGREDDLLILNYLTGGEEKENPSPYDHQLSNTTNPFSFGTADNLNSLIVGLMREAGGDGAMWKGRARTMLKGLLSALCYKRDKYGMLLDINVIRDFFPLDKIISLSRDPELRSSARDPLRKYLLDLPGFTEDSAVVGDISPKAYEQHNYLTMQLTEVMSDLSETYGKIFGVPLGEIDFKDVLFNRRILFCLLPSLEKDPDALEGLGKLVVAGLRSALAPALGSQVEGLKREVIDTKPTNSKVPFFIILDEYGYYAVQGFAVVAAQARSLGVSVIFAGQDIPSLKKASEEEAKATIANTNIKICMKMEDPKDTAEVFIDRAGESSVAVSEHHEDGMMSFKKKGETRLQKEKVINVRDLVDQDPGQAHVIFRNDISRCRFFYYDPIQVNEAKLNKYIMVDKPSSKIIKKLEGATEKLDDLFKKGKAPKKSPVTKDNGLRALLHDMKWAAQFNEGPLESAYFCTGMIELRNHIKDVDVEKEVAPKAKTESKSSSKSLDDIGNKVQTSLEKDVADTNTNSDKKEEESSIPSKQESAIDTDPADPLAELFNSFEEIDDDELMKLFEGDDEIDSLEEKANETSASFSEMLEGALRSNQDKTGIDNPKSAKEQLSEFSNEKEAERDIEVLGKTSVYPSEPTPDKKDKAVINERIQHILGRIDKDKSKIN